MAVLWTLGAAVASSAVFVGVYIVFGFLGVLEGQGWAGVAAWGVAMAIFAVIIGALARVAHRRLAMPGIAWVGISVPGAYLAASMILGGLASAFSGRSESWMGGLAILLLTVGAFGVAWLIANGSRE